MTLAGANSELLSLSKAILSSSWTVFPVRSTPLVHLCLVWIKFDFFISILAACVMWLRELLKSKMIVFDQDVPFWGKSRKCHIQFWVIPRTVIAIGPAGAMSHCNKFKTCAQHGTKNASGFQPNLQSYIFFFTNHVSTIIIDLPCSNLQIV